MSIQTSLGNDDEMRIKLYKNELLMLKRKYYQIENEIRKLRFKIKELEKC